MNKIGLSLFIFALASQIFAATPSQTRCSLLLAHVLSPEFMASESSFQEIMKANFLDYVDEGFHFEKLDTLDFLLSHLKQLPHRSPKSDLTVADLRKIIRSVSEHPVAALCHLAKQDPRGTLGFCFGRAMAAHLEAVLQGVDERNIKRLFILGDFSVPGENTRWTYHATTIVRSKLNRWYAIDPRLERPVEVKKWAQYWMQFGTTRYFLVGDPNIFFPCGYPYEACAYFKVDGNDETLDHQRISDYLRALAQSYLDSFRSLSSHGTFSALISN